MTVHDAAVLAAVAGVLVGWLALRAGARVARAELRAIRRHARRRIAWRLVDAAIDRLADRHRRRRTARRAPGGGVDLARPDHLATCPLAAQARQGRQPGPGRCRWCARPLPDRARRWCRPECRVTDRGNHEFPSARDATLAADGYACRRCGAQATHDHALEVHHGAVPALGRHAQPGCWHHLAGLETLCHDCHAPETARQRRRGWVA